MTAETHAAAAASAAVTGHFGEWLQGRLGPDGPVALVTVPCARFAATVRRRSGDGVSLGPRLRQVIDAASARAFLRAARADATGTFELQTAAAGGRGAGMSTAALLAFARAAGARAGPEALARACVAAEGASDPLMHPSPERLLWASRLGEVLDRTPPLPVFELVGGFFGAPEPTDPTDARFPDISDLAARWRAAAGQGDRAALAAVAAASARRTTALRGPRDDPMPD
ncbi:MAG: propanediol utilization protein, partial [Pseudomonadota bacterium]